MITASVTVARSAYIWERMTEFFVKGAVQRAAKHRSAFGRFAVIPTEFVGSNVIANGLYERHQLTLIRAIVERQGLGDTVALDIGANIGNHTIVFSKWFRDVIAFEPNPSVAVLLEANVVLAGCENVQVKRVGLGAGDASLPFTLDTEGNDGHGSFAITGSKTIELPVRNGDQLLSELDVHFASGDRRIGFIKCDVEGFEASVFSGLGETLTRHSAIVLFESDHRGPGQEAYNALKQAGYKHLYAIRETGDNSRGKLHRELQRLFSRYQFWIEPVEGVPSFWSNLVATKTPLI
jgi:FkbM family methyltransferase